MENQIPADQQIQVNFLDLECIQWYITFSFLRVDGIGAMAGYKIGGYGSPSRDRVVYVTTCLIGHHVEVQVKDGSIYSGIFHAAEKDFGMLFWI